MQFGHETPLRKVARSCAPVGLFFVPFYLYVWRAIDPRLVHHGLGILVPYSPFAFHTGWPFFWEHIARPGGLVQYFTRGLSQCYVFGWGGALIITGAAGATCLFAGMIGRRAGVSRGRVLRYLPAAIVLVMYCGYNHPLAPVVSLLAALTAFWLYGRLAPEGPIKRVAAIVVVSAAVYHFAGAGGLLFPVLVAIDESLTGKRPALAAAALVCVPALPWIASVCWGLDFVEGFVDFPFSAPGVAPSRWSYALALYLFFPTLLAAGALGKGGRAAATNGSPAEPAVAPKTRKRARRPREERSPCRGPRRISLPRVPSWVLAATFFCGIGVAAWLSLDLHARSVLEMDYDAQHEQWTEVLALADRMPVRVFNPRSNRNIVQALYHTGRLGDELFRYPQRRDADWFSTVKEHRDLGTFFQESRLWLDLGEVDLAERCAYEALATLGDEPALLEHLAVIQVVKGRPETAKMFLGALARHPFHRCAAQETLGRLEADPALADDRRIAAIRANMPSRDIVAQAASAEDLLQVLLEKNPHNRMAFELLMARYLCGARPEKAVANLARWKDFSYSAVPRHYQEAWAFEVLSSDGSRLKDHSDSKIPRRLQEVWGYEAPSSDPPPSLPGLALDPEVLQRARDFQRIVGGAANPQQAFGPALEAGLGDSYWFYLVYGVSAR